MSIHKQILEAQQHLDDMRDLFEHGEIDRERVKRAEHELNDLRWVRDNLRPQAVELLTEEVVYA